jgi:hypothetical protein
LIPHTAAMEKGTEMIADTPIFVFVFSTIPNARIMMPARYINSRKKVCLAFLILTPLSVSAFADLFKACKGALPALSHL